MPIAPTSPFSLEELGMDVSYGFEECHLSYSLPSNLFL